MLSENFKTNYKKITEKAENAQSSLLALLHEIQRENRHIGEEDLNGLSELTGLPYARIKTVLTFYNMYNAKKTGKYHLQVCRNLSCHMAGAPNLLKRLKEKLKIKENEISDDGLFSYSEVECLGACGTAPVVSVNETYHENMDTLKLDKLIEELKAIQGQRSKGTK